MKKRVLSLLLTASLAFPALAQKEYVPVPENVQARKEFQDNKFGIFLHYGIYSMLADGEWAMHNKNLNYKEYAKLAGGFYPSKFNAAEWVAAIKASGAKYICFTTRHHDGFSMFDSKYTDYNVVKATPFKRDIVKELADECHKQGIKIHFYYSHIDWYRNDYYPLGRTGHGTGRTTHGEWKTYYQFMNNQLTELLTNYGPVGAIWFDGWWDQDQNPGFDWQLPEQYAMIHKLQPACLVGNNHHQTPFPGEDIQIFERDLPGENNAGLSGQEVSPLPLETCETMNGMWGYKITDQDYKSTKTLIHYLVKAAGMNANLLMNIGPQPNGELPAISVERLKEMGEWMKIYSETIYGTRGGIVPPHDWGVTTQKSNKLYVHILNLQDKGLFLPITDQKIKKAVMFTDKTPVKFTQDKQGVVLKLAEVPTDIDYVIELDL
ncbi:alpha-L-fucosidase [Parabacteroides acidifaciens]|uniref:alpha-L-fucosidase n=1 Tax=Parabacteroides acidifaciens TaxID=2290935 RepID=A0A3D8HCH2_9BACT|nr:alpha-L-fucosidase [Parabacteroides acidifaciens]MBC8602829.1 alpha-L-fucosidase [Parabacteroides acidifaciens]RDU48450.1 alpha-L-fucosidase [Parabacteroides acidifaciens]